MRMKIFYMCSTDHTWVFYLAQNFLVCYILNMYIVKNEKVKRVLTFFRIKLYSEESKNSGV